MKDQQKYIVLIDSNHEYNIVQTNKKNKVVYELFSSCNDIWAEHIRDTKLISIIDYKDEFETIYHTKNKNQKKIDASDMRELKILINFITKGYDKNVEIYNTDTKIKL